MSVRLCYSCVDIKLKEFINICFLCHIALNYSELLHDNEYLRFPTNIFTLNNKTVVFPLKGKRKDTFLSGKQLLSIKKRDVFLNVLFSKTNRPIGSIRIVVLC